ncbi:MAG: BamA/TamA family outer membrane protein, partial [Gemmatimonadota bacterium]
AVGARVCCPALRGGLGNPFSLNSSLSALILGYDDGQYYRALGGDVRYASGGGSMRFDGRLFAEHHLVEDKQTDISLPDLFGSVSQPPNLAADEIDVFGASVRLRAQAGFDPESWVVLGSAWGEAGTGTREYARLAVSFGVSRPVLRRLAAAFDVSAGTTWGDLPAQRRWLLGGPSSLRAFPGGSVSGAAFWLGRLELAYGLPLVRLAGFADIGWAGDRARFLSEDPAISAGIGVSVLDGIVRVDFAHVIDGRRPRRLRVHVYLDGIL